MNKKEFDKAVSLAKSGDYGCEVADCFVGFALPDFKPCVCTLEMVASLIAWQALQLNGEFDQEALQMVFRHKHKFTIVGDYQKDLSDATQELLDSMWESDDELDSIISSLSKRFRVTRKDLIDSIPKGMFL